MSHRTKFVFNTEIGARPYKWAQTLGDLNFFRQPHELVDPLKYTLKEVIARIKGRIKSHQAIEYQVASLSKLKIPVARKVRLPIKSTVTLTNFTEITYEEYRGKKKTSSSRHKHRRYRTREHRKEKPSTTPTIPTVTKTEEGEVEAEAEEGELSVTEPTTNTSIEKEDEEGAMDNEATMEQQQPKEVDAPQTTTEISPKQPKKKPWESFNCKYCKATFKCDKDDIQAYIEVSCEYPIRSPRFKLRYSHHQQSPFYPPEVASKCNPNALAAVTTHHAKTFDNNLKHLETELNVYCDQLLDKGEDQFLLLSHQIRMLKTSLDIIHEFDRKGKESVLAKLLGQPFRGRDRRRPFSYQDLVPL